MNDEGLAAPGARLTEATRIIGAEYAELCDALGVAPVATDIYLIVEEAGPTDLTALGTCLANATPGYSGNKKILVLPLYESNLPSESLVFPPGDLGAAAWPIWRIELWHEFAHQVSDQIFSSWDPAEPGRNRGRRGLSTAGHGRGWWQGLSKVATRFGFEPEPLDALLD